jgi:hypothetical protein
MVVTCEYGNKLPSFIKFWEFLDYLQIISFPRRPLLYRVTVLGSLTGMRKSTDAHASSENTNRSRGFGVRSD